MDERLKDIEEEIARLKEYIWHVREEHGNPQQEKEVQEEIHRKREQYLTIEKEIKERKQMGIALGKIRHAKWLQNRRKEKQTKNSSLFIAIAFVILVAVLIKTLVL